MTSKVETIENIVNALALFNTASSSDASKHLLNILGYYSDKTLELINNSPSAFLQQFNPDGKFSQSKACFDEWSSVKLIFQLTDAEVRERLGQHELFTAGPVENTNINSFLFFSLCLQSERYTRTQLASITREINKLFLMPVVILFSYNQKLSVGIITHRVHKKDASKDVLEKVTLIKDINTAVPHRAHLEVLFDLSIDQLELKTTLRSFKDLQLAWQKTLDIEELNKKFYKEIADWYFWATKSVFFPVGRNQESEENRNAINLIRLITRIIFVWFLKEKHLVPDDLFNEDKLIKILNDLDASSSSFYKAILQNLFFATLNQEMNKPGKAPVRKFRLKNNHPGGRDGNRLVTNLYRYEDCFKDPNLALQLFEGIPFLNGGLFECLDKEIEVNGVSTIIRIDGFSDEDKNPLSVPNELFFGPEREVDLNDIYRTSNKRYKVQGLIHVLDSYKFTVEENTPINEEVALDPELLGKVFENLLASFNPETSSTARKATGSYYTPRPIVEYMVDESLIAYLKNYLSTYGLPDDSAGSALVSSQLNLIGESQLVLSGQASLDERIRGLVSYTDLKPDLSIEECRLLVEAIDELNILDPACGSGAFPMGILLKLVHILQKLDPENQIWQEIQLNKAVKETEEAFKIGDKEERHLRILDIEEAFDNNTSDYGRKLYLIESCLYGVDIQPIAVQVAKLRFFISLIVDQTPNPDKENLGIRPLPNLETKLVAANSLIALDHPLQATLPPHELSVKESELAQIRHKLFSAHSLETKRKYRGLDKEKREEIRALLVQSGWASTSAKSLADWDPYDQNASAPFFDPEWMLGVTSGFDIVLGNPPYIQLQKEGGALANLYANKGYETFNRMGDIYCLFYELGYKLLREGGHLCFITSNKWMRAGYGEALRKFFAEKTDPKLLIDFTGKHLFDNVTVDNNILLYQKSENTHSCKTLTAGDEFRTATELSNYINANLDLSHNFVDSGAWVISSPIEDKIRRKIETLGTPLGDWDIKILYGVKTGCNDAFIIDETTKERLIQEDPNSSEIIKPVLRGRDIKRYHVEFANLWIIFVPWHFPLHQDQTIRGASQRAEKLFQTKYPAVYRHLSSYRSMLEQRNRAETGIRYEWYALQRCAASYYLEFQKEIIVWKAVGRNMTFALWGQDKYLTAPASFISSENNKYLLAFLQSNYGKYFFYKYSDKTGAGDIMLSIQSLEKLPVPKPSPIEKATIEKIIIEILGLVNSARVTNDPECIKQLTKLELELNQYIYSMFKFSVEECLFIESSITQNKGE